MGAASILIQQIGIERIQPAFDLLLRFLTEEGFDTAPDQIRLNLQEFLGNPAYGTFLAYLNNEPVGIATVSTAISVELGGMAEFDDLYVLPAARNRGVAKALIESALNWCRTEGRAYVQVTVTPEGEAAHSLTRFYRKLGFADTDRKLLSRSLTQ